MVDDDLNSQNGDTGVTPPVKDSDQKSDDPGVSSSDQPVKKRRRRRRRSSSVKSVDKQRAEVIAVSGMDMTNDEANEALDQPRESVREMEEENEEKKKSPRKKRTKSKPIDQSVEEEKIKKDSKESDNKKEKDSEPAQTKYSISIAPNEPKKSEAMVYQAPVYNPPSPQTGEVPTSNVEPKIVEKVSSDEALPNSNTDAPVFSPFESTSASSSEPSPFDLASSFSSSSVVEDSSPPYSPPSSPEVNPFGPPSPPPNSDTVTPASSSEPSPFDLASSFSSSPVVEDSFSPYSPPSAPYGYNPSSSPEVNPFGPPSIPEPEPIAPEPEPIAPESEPIEAELVEESSSEIKESIHDMGESETFSDRLQNLLAEANLTTRHVKFCCGGLVVVVGVILLGFYIFPRLLSGDFPFFGGDDSEVIVEETVEDEEIDEEEIEEDEEVETSGPVWVDPSIYNGLLLGDPKADLEIETGVDSGIIVGGEEDGPAVALSQFQLYISDLEDLYNLYFVDIQALLDGSTNRTNALDEHIEMLKDFYNNGVDNYEAIGEIKSKLSDEFDEIDISKEEVELAFFEELDAFNGAEAEAFLLEFIELKQELVDLNATSLAFSNIENSYEIVLEALSPLITDLKLNREALISGVQVVDVLGSDIDLVLGEEDLEN